MARLNSYHLPPESWPADNASATLLAGPEARHLLGVLRARVGETVRLFDGQGRFGLFRISSVLGKDKAELAPLELSFDPRPASGLVLALGWNKSARREWVLEKAVELGALGLLFWQAERSQGSPPAGAKDTWREKCVQAAKQCGAVWLPELGVAPGGVDGLVRSVAEYDNCFLLDEAAPVDALPDPALLAAGRNLVVIGPEGGLDRREAERLTQAGCTALSLGPRPLRWETAALYCLGLTHFGVRTRELSGT